MFKHDRQRTVGDWLIHFADPLGPHTAPPSSQLSAQQWAQLVAEADLHGVLPVLLRNFPSTATRSMPSAVKAEALARLQPALSHSLMLGARADAIIKAATDLPIAMVKGPVFAYNIYPTPSLRTFNDIELLVAPGAIPGLARLLEAHEFRLSDHDPSRQLWKWIHRETQALVVEVQTNLVHNPKLRAAMSVTFQDLAGIAETPAALLMVAVTHGALDRFERLRHVVDICQAARQMSSSAEEQRFEALILQTGVRFAACVGLDLTYRLLAEPRCRELAKGLGPVHCTSVARLLIDRTTVTSSMNIARAYHSWRRQSFRQLLKWSRSF
jgi:Uncharacterised nucleotidyltransferase